MVITICRWNISTDMTCAPVRKKLDVLDKIRVIEDIARALHYAGEKGYVHRDIKPENIMFRKADGSAVLTDFGIAKAVENDLSMTQAGTAIGTPHYMSPEQAKGKVVDNRSDLYSLGIVFFQLLTGRVPFDGESAVAIGVKHITEPLPLLPSELAQLQPVLDGLLAKSPENRYQNGLALLNDLRTLDLRELENTEAQPVIVAKESLGEGDLDDSQRFTIEYELNESIQKPSTSWWPMFFALSFVAIAVLAIIYISRPTVIENEIVAFERMVGKLENEAEKYAETGQKFIQEQLKEDPKDTSERQNAETIEPTPLDTRPVAAPSPESESQFGSDTLVIGEGTLRRDADSGVDSDADVNSAGANSVVMPKALNQPEEAIELVEAPGERGSLRDPDDNSNELESIPAVEALSVKIDRLRLEADRDPRVFPAFIEAHRELLQFYPTDESTLNSLAQVKTDKRNQIYAQASAGRREQMEKLLELYQAWFPESAGGELLRIKQKRNRS